LILGVGKTLIGRLLLYNAVDMSFDFVNLRKNPKCKICGPNPEVTELIDYEEFCGVPGHDHEEEGSAGDDWDISVAELSERLEEGEKIRLIDVREPHEWDIVHLEDAELIPLGEMATRMNELDSADEMVIFCKTGTRSAQVIGLLHGAGFRKMKNLKGGIISWAKEIDKKLPIY